MSARGSSRELTFVFEPLLQKISESGRKYFRARLSSTNRMKNSEPHRHKISLESLRAHDQGAWNHAYEALWQVAWRSAKRKLPYDSAEQLEDLAATVLAKEIVPQIISPKQSAFVSAEGFADILNLTSRIVSNRSIDEIRRRIRQPESQDISKTPELELSPLPVEQGIHEEMHLALSNLEDRFRQVVEDFYFEDLNTEEIALKRGRPKGSNCSDLVKARRLLGETLQHSLTS